MTIIEGFAVNEELSDAFTDLILAADAFRWKAAGAPFQLRDQTRKSVYYVDVREVAARKSEELAKILWTPLEPLVSATSGGRPVDIVLDMLNCRSLDSLLPAACRRVHVPSMDRSGDDLTGPWADAVPTDVDLHGQRVLVVVDVVTTGNTVVDLIEEIRQRGGQIRAVIVCLDRQECGPCDAGSTQPKSESSALESLVAPTGDLYGVPVVRISCLSYMLYAVAVKAPSPPPAPAPVHRLDASMFRYLEDYLVEYVRMKQSGGPSKNQRGNFGESERAYYDRIVPFVHAVYGKYRVGVSNGLDGVGDEGGVGILIPRTVPVDAYDRIKTTLAAVISISYFEPASRL